MILTPKQENFVLNLFQGMSQRDAYLKAGYSSKQLPGTIDKCACVLFQSPKILERYNELRTQTETPLVMDVTERKEKLSEIGRGKFDSIRAIDTLNKMDKIYTEVQSGYQDNRVINIIVSSEKAKELTENIGESFLEEGRDGKSVTEAEDVTEG